jgi:hypothetical protein
MSDANFPEQARSFQRGMAIKYYEIIYQKYSTLNFSHAEDRPFAMEGLESKILDAYETSGRFGLLHRFRHRSLLWQSDTSAPLVRINHKTIERVPSWSWMAVDGPIKFLAVGFDSVDWKDDIISPFQDVARGLDATDIKSRTDLPIIATAKNINPNAVEQKKNLNDTFFLDASGSVDTVPGLKCVVVATQKGPPWATAYVLLVKPMGQEEGDFKYYERIGVARLDKSNISDERGLLIKIV